MPWSYSYRYCIPKLVFFFFSNFIKISFLRQCSLAELFIFSIFISISHQCSLVELFFYYLILYLTFILMLCPWIGLFFFLSEVVSFVSFSSWCCVLELIFLSHSYIHAISSLFYFPSHFLINVVLLYGSHFSTYVNLISMCSHLWFVFCALFNFE